MVVVKGMVMADFTPEAIGEAFGIPLLEGATTVTIDEAQLTFDTNPSKCKILVNEG